MLKENDNICPEMLGKMAKCRVTI